MSPVTLALVYAFGCLSADWTGDGAVDDFDVRVAEALFDAGTIDAGLHDLTAQAAAFCPPVGTVATITIPYGTTPALVAGGWLLTAEGLLGPHVVTRACHVTGPCCYGRALPGAAWACSAGPQPSLEVTWAVIAPGFASALVEVHP